MKLSKKILGLSLIPISLLILGSFISGSYVFNSNKVTESYVVDHVNRQTKVYEILKNMGYGGGIHTFKNYILRFKEEDRIKSKELLNKALSIVENYLKIQKISDVEIKAMHELNSILIKYLGQIETVQEMIANGFSRSAIDKAVKVDDTKALYSLKQLQKYFNQSRDKHLEQLSNSNAKALNSLIWLFSIAVILSVVMSRTISKQLLTSIKRLVEIAEEITNRNTNITAKSISSLPDDELKNLGNQMITMGNDITTLIEELNESNKQLKNSNEELTDFAFIASHDLQEPAKLISAYIDLLEMEVEENLSEEGKTFITIVKSSSIRMIHLIKTLLNYSKVANVSLNMEPVDLNDVFSQSKLNLELSIIKNDAHFTKVNLPIVIGNKNLLESLFQNIFSNSIKYKIDGQRPEIKISSEKLVDNRWKISIHDKGMGFDEKNLDIALRPFGRIHNKKDFPGLGIGLALCKKIVESHGGTLLVESNEGKGCKVSFTLESIPE
jgi:signal transduction histidine kinase